MSTVFCPNKLCGKEISDQFDNCPFCGTSLAEVTGRRVGIVEPKSEKQVVKTVERSGWYTYATVMLVLSVVGLIILAILSISEGNGLYICIGLGEFISFSLLCGIVQLLAGIKQGVDSLQNR